ncbi:MAG: hypothetical protein CMI54_06405 [Parcubacteria group bacterium]|jgi:hypothetical protein|nr:hypothetical protein [Parcubacteria group bacterium]|tara:strand:+ start:1967 stop:2299 length:333 start_codon:yes stop_codon:yes gene_type:complete
MPLQDILNQRFGVKTRPVEGDPSTQVGTTAALLVKNNPNRLALLIINLSTNIIYLGLTQGVASTQGIRLNSGGGSAVFTPESDFIAPSWAWWAIASGANSDVYTLEILEQ